MTGQWPRLLSGPTWGGRKGFPGQDPRPVKLKTKLFRIKAQVATSSPGSWRNGSVNPTLVGHIVAGSLGLISGFVALYSTKGIPLHRRAGIVFVCTMIAMCLSGLSMAVLRGISPIINAPAALLTGALVVTGFTTVRPPSQLARRVDIGATIVLLAVGVGSTILAVQAVATGENRSLIPLFLIWGITGLLAGVSDIRILRSGPLHGTRRLVRHLWRMSYALTFASLSFFIGQAKVIPEPIRIKPLLMLPILAVILTMFYWLWRVRVRQSLRGFRLKVTT